MGTLSSLSIAYQTDGFARTSINAIVVVLALPLIGLVFQRFIESYYPWLSSMSAGEAITVFGVVGGAAGLATQSAVTYNLERLDRPVHILELLPAVGAVVIASGVLTYALLPPNPLIPVPIRGGSA
jgi:hypothetical protein